MPLHAGSAEVEITPEDPVPMSGYGVRTDRSTGTNDPLKAIALVLDDGSTMTGIVSVDLLNVSRPLVSGVEDRLAADGIVLDELILAATHTHGGPYVPAPVIDIHPSLGREADVSAVMADLKSDIADALATAHGRLEPATLRVGTAKDGRTMVNRRANMHARIPVETVDSEVTAVLVEGASGSETVLYNLACHPVCTTATNTLMTADWPGYARRQITAERNGDSTVLFLNGAAGDVTTRGRHDESRCDTEFAYAEAMGTELAMTVLQAVASAESNTPHDIGPILIDRQELRLPVKSAPSAETLNRRERELRETRDRLRADGADEAASRYDREVRYVRELRAIGGWNVRNLPARLRYVEVGPIGVVSIPGEALVQHGIDFKEHADVDALLVAGYADDYLGYIPPLRELENWGYEVWTTKLAPEGIVQFKDAGLNLVSNSEPPVNR